MGANVLIVNNVRDIPDDRSVGKHTLATALGPKACAVLYALNAVAGVALTFSEWMAIAPRPIATPAAISHHPACQASDNPANAESKSVSVIEGNSPNTLNTVIKAWIEAMRLRTLPVSMAGVAVAVGFAEGHGPLVCQIHRNNSEEQNHRHFSKAVRRHGIGASAIGNNMNGNTNHALVDCMVIRQIR